MNQKIIRDDIIQYLQKALDLANNSYSKGDFPIGGMFLINDNIIIEGQNKVKSQNNIFLHAEIDIINKAEKYKGKRDKKILFVSMEPCHRCAMALLDFGIDEVYYMLEDPSWGGKRFLEVNGVKVEQIGYKYKEYLELMIDFLISTGQFKELLSSFEKRLSNFITIPLISTPIQIPGLNFDINQITSIQKNSKTILEKIDSDKINSGYNSKQLLFTLIEERMFRYIPRIRDEYNLKKEEEIKERFYIIVNDITNYTYNLLQKDSQITQEELNELHKKLYPKGLWGRSKGAGGRTIQVLFLAGEYRNKREFVIYDGIEYDYLHYGYINNSLKQVYEFLDEKEIHPLIKIIISLNTFWYIHPYFNGNGTLFIIFSGLLLLKNGYLIPQDFANKIQKMVENKYFHNADKGDYEGLIRGFLEMFEKK